MLQIYDISGIALEEEPKRTSNRVSQFIDYWNRNNSVQEVNATMDSRDRLRCFSKFLLTRGGGDKHAVMHNKYASNKSRSERTIL